MKSNTIKWRIFKYNIIIIVLLIALVTVIFNVTIRLYMEKEILGQMNRIASRTEETALRKGPDFFPNSRKTLPMPPHEAERERNKDNESINVFRYYFILDRSLREPLSMLNANYILLDSSKSIINPLPAEYSNVPADLPDKITNEISKLTDTGNENYLNFNLSGVEYIAVVKQVSEKNSFGLGWIIIYSSLQKVNQLQIGINIILSTILIFSALILALFSSIIAKKVSAPFSSLNQHIRAIAERNFGTKVQVPVYDELQELVSNFNIMSEKLETYDKAQKTFLQNASHEFRTPLMSIQSYAEGIKYNIMDGSTAADIIIDESKRLTHLVEDLLYLSRLDTIEENYHFDTLDVNELIKTCIERMNVIALKSNISITADMPADNIYLYADEEKLFRAITNIISNCMRYAENTIAISVKTIENDKIEITISDDGSGFDSNELPNIFERFYKGKKGNLGLGLAITKNVIEKYKGKISAENSESGAAFKIVLPMA